MTDRDDDLVEEPTPADADEGGPDSFFIHIP